MKKILTIGLGMLSLSLILVTTPVTANAKVYSTLPKALRGNWKRHRSWVYIHGSFAYENADIYHGAKHSFWTGRTQQDTYPEKVRYVVSKGHGIYKVHTTTDMGGIHYHIDTFKRTKNTLRIKGYITFTSHHKAIE